MKTTINQEKPLGRLEINKNHWKSIEIRACVFNFITGGF